LIDSDKNGRFARINETKRRVRDEFNEGPGFAWITKGREIENYIKPETLLNAVKSVHPTADKLVKIGQYDNCLPFRNKNGKINKKVDKVKVAHEIVKLPANLDVLDLRMRLYPSHLFIRIFYHPSQSINP
jgi:hypothetical protein